jgi:hypothetical protein
MNRSLILTLTILTLLAVAAESGAPFLDFNELHPTKSEFEFNIILN